MRWLLAPLVLIRIRQLSGEDCPEPHSARQLLQFRTAHAQVVADENQSVVAEGNKSWNCGSLPSWYNRTKRVAVLLRGESFREGHQHSRRFGFRIQDQLEATRSAMAHLIEPLERQGLVVDVFSSTYDSAPLPRLLSILQAHLRLDVRTPLPGSQITNARDVVDAFHDFAMGQEVSYRAVVMLRHDMVLKMDLGSKLAGRLEGGQFLVPFQMMKKVRFFKDRVPDTLQVIPPRFLGCFRDLLSEEEDWPKERIWKKMKEKVGEEHFGFVLPHVQAGSDPEKIWNPLYKFAGRGEAPRADELGTLPSNVALLVGVTETSAGAYVVVGLLCIALAGSAATLLLPHAVEKATGISLAYATCAMYAVLSISIDLSIVHASRETSQGYAFSPAALVATVEFVKLVVSACMASSRVLFSSKCPTDSVRPCMLEGACLIIPAFLYAANNMVVFKALASVHLATFGVMRETSLLWTAILWVCIFQVSIGWKRWLAMLGIFLGVTGNLLPDLLRSSLTSSCIWVAVQAFLTAAGAVSNEFTFKRMPPMDINLQNCILYCFTGTFTVVYMLIFEPSVVSSPAAFVAGFTPSCWQVIMLQVVTGLLVSRILKHADAISKSVVAALRGPGVIFLGAIIFQQHLKLSGVLSAAAVSLAAFMYLREGPLPR